MESLAVVPIFVSAGAAAIPTIAAAVTGVLAVLLKPRELLAICRRRPVAAGITFSSIAIAIAMLIWLPGSGAFARSKPPTSSTKIDWARVARDILAQESAGRIPSIPGIATTPPPPTPATQPAVAAAPTKLKPLWSFQPEETLFLASPAVMGNRVYVAGCQSDLGGYTGLLACIDLQTGKPIWQVSELAGDVLKPFFSSPAITADGKSLLIGQGLHQDRDCSLLCFDTATGKLRWRVKSTLHIESSPAIQGDVVIVGAGAIEGRDGKPTGDAGHVFAVRISDGKELWRHPLIDPECSPAIDESGIAYIGSGFNGNAVVALRLDPAGERVVWKTAVNLPVIGAVEISGDLIVVGAGNGDAVHSNRNASGAVIALDRKTGEIRWQTPLEDAVLGAVSESAGIVVCPVRTGEVVGLSVKDGSVVWRTRVNGQAPVLTGCTIAGDVVYAASNDGYLALLKLQSGELLEKHPLNAPGKPGSGLTMSTPRIVGGQVIIGSETGGMRSLIGTGGGR